MLPILQSGNPKNPPLIFLHGFLGAKEDFTDLFTKFPNHFCLAFDLPGHGNVPFDPKGNPFEWIIEKILETCRAKEIQTFSLIAYSMGGRLALHLLKNHAERLETTLIISAHLGLLDFESKRLQHARDLERAEHLEKDFGKFLENWYAGPLFYSLKKTAHFPQIFARRNQNNPIELAKTLRALSLAKQKPFWDIPKENALFVCGEKDTKYRDLYQKIPGHTMIKGVGHAPHLENPDTFIQTVQPYFKEMSHD